MGPTRPEESVLGSDTATTASSSLRRSVASGVRWGGLHQVAEAVIRLGTTVVLTHLLTPADFGVMGIATVVIGLTAVITGLGLGDALVQHRQIRPVHISSVFVASAGSGLVLAVAVIAAAPALAGFFNQDRLRDVLFVMSGTCLFRGLERTPNDMLIRELSFRRFYLSSTIAAAAGALAGIVVALIRPDVWALVAMAVAESATATILGWAFAMGAGLWRPGLGFQLGALRELLGFSFSVTGTTSLGFLSNNIDDLLVGKLLGSRALGYYSLAYGVMVAIGRLSVTVSNAAYPAMVRVQDDRERLRRAYLEASRYIMLLCLPLAIGVAVTGPVLVPLVFGSQWRPAEGALILLALSGPALLLTQLSGRLYTAIGLPNLALARSVGGVILYIPAFVIGVHYGVNGVAGGFTVVCYLRAPVDLWLSARTVGARTTALLANVAPMAISVAGMALAAWGVGSGLAHGAPIIRLTGMVAAGAGTYLGLVAVLERRTLLDAVANLSGRRR